MHVLEVIVWHVNFVGCAAVVAVYFGSLIRDALPSSEASILVDSLPDESFLEALDGGLDSWVR